MVKLFSVLRKLGILRAGYKKTVYKNSKERPIEFQQEYIFNSTKDLIYSDQKKEDKK